MIRNTDMSYGSVAKWLHWLTALLILVACLLVLYLNLVLHGEGPMRSPVIRLHKAVGASILIFILLRLWWRATNPSPKLPESMPKWQVPFDYFHYEISGPFLLWMIIAAHAGAAIYHHYVEKDDVLKRMLPEKT